MKYYKLNVNFHMEHVHDNGDKHMLAYISKVIYTSKARASDAMPNWKETITAIVKKNYLHRKEYALACIESHIAEFKTDEPKSTYLTSMFKRREHRARAIKRGAK